MARFWTVELSNQEMSVRVRLSHYYPNGRNNPWALIAGDEDGIGTEGHWAHNQRGFMKGEIRMYTPKDVELAILFGFQELKVGKIGEAWCSTVDGYLLGGGRVEWEMIRID